MSPVRPRCVAPRFRRAARLALAGLAVCAPASAVAADGSPVHRGHQAHPCGEVSSATAPVVERAQALMCLVNDARRNAGVRPLAARAVLVEAATRKGARIAACGEFSHTPCGDAVGRQVHALGYGAAVGENIYATTATASPLRVFRSWMDSAGHRANILRASFGEHGLGIRVGPPARLDGSFAAREIWVHAFGALPAGARPRPDWPRQALVAPVRSAPRAPAHVDDRAFVLPLAPPAVRAEPGGGTARVVHRLRIDEAGRYSFILRDAAGGRRVPQRPGSTLGHGVLRGAASAPVVTVRPGDMRFRGAARMVLVMRVARAALPRASQLELVVVSHGRTPAEGRAVSVRGTGAAVLD